MGAVDDLPPVTVERVDRFDVVRDDLVPGGTKQRALVPILAGPWAHVERLVYAGPAQGYAQVALAYACATVDVDLTLFVPARDTPTDLTVRAHAAGARVVHVPYGRLTVLNARARLYADVTGATVLPLGVDVPEFADALYNVAAQVDLDPPEVWVAAGSGLLTRVLQRRWPDADHYAVQVGGKPDAGNATVLQVPERFDQPARVPPPFPSAAYYDAKVWRLIRDHGTDGALLWNVAA